MGLNPVGYEVQCRLLQESFTRQGAEDVAFLSLYGRRWFSNSDQLPPGELWEQCLAAGAIKSRAKQLSLLIAFARDITGNPFRPRTTRPPTG